MQIHTVAFPLVTRRQAGDPRGPPRRGPRRRRRPRRPRTILHGTHLVSRGGGQNVSNLNLLILSFPSLLLEEKVSHS